MYPRGSPNAYSASNRVRDFELGIDKDFFRSLSRMAVPLCYPRGTATVRERADAKTPFRNDWDSLLCRLALNVLAGRKPVSAFRA